MVDDQQQAKNDSPLDLLEDILQEAQGATAAQEKLAAAEKKQAEAQAAREAQVKQMREQQTVQDQQKIIEQKQKMTAVIESPEVKAQQAQYSRETQQGEPAETDYQIQQLEHTKIEVEE